MDFAILILSSPTPRPLLHAFEQQRGKGYTMSKLLRTYLDLVVACDK
jgi:hypothetical protein